MSVSHGEFSSVHINDTHKAFLRSRGYELREELGAGSQGCVRRAIRVPREPLPTSLSYSNFSKNPSYSSNVSLKRSSTGNQNGVSSSEIHQLPVSPHTPNSTTSLVIEDSVAIKIMKKSPIFSPAIYHESKILEAIANEVDKWLEAKEVSLSENELASDLEAFLNDVDPKKRSMRRRAHPNLLAYEETIEDDDHVYIVTEYLGSGTLSEKIECRGSLSEYELLIVAKGLLSAVSFLHERNFSHRDIKLENIGFGLDVENPKLIDFGTVLMRKVTEDDEATEFCGSPYYICPEMASGKRYSGRKADMWSVGVLLYASVAGRFPFRGEAWSDVKESIINNSVEFPGRRWEEISPDVQKLIHGLLNRNPEERLNAFQSLDMVSFLLKKLTKRRGDGGFTFSPGNAVLRLTRKRSDCRKNSYTDRAKPEERASLRNLSFRLPNLPSFTLGDSKSKEEIIKNEMRMFEKRQQEGLKSLSRLSSFAHCLPDDEKSSSSLGRDRLPARDPLTRGRSAVSRQNSLRTYQTNSRNRLFADRNRKSFNQVPEIVKDIIDVDNFELLPVNNQSPGNSNCERPLGDKSPSQRNLRERSNEEKSPPPKRQDKYGQIRVASNSIGSPPHAKSKSRPKRIMSLRPGFKQNPGGDNVIQPMSARDGNPKRVSMRIPSVRSFRRVDYMVAPESNGMRANGTSPISSNLTSITSSSLSSAGQKQRKSKNGIIKSINNVLRGKTKKDPQ